MSMVRPFRSFRAALLGATLLVGGTPAAAPVAAVAGGVGIAAAGTLLLPGSAEARPGGGFSFGSRGSRTYSAPPATGLTPGGGGAFNRSMTSPGYGNLGTAQTRPGFGGYNSGFGRPHRPFATAFVGGLVGAGLAGMLMGHGLFGGGFSGGSLLGMLIQLALLFFVVRWFLRRFVLNRTAPAGAVSGGPGGPNGFGFNPGPVPAQNRGAMFGGGGGRGAALALTNADYQAFEQLLLDIQQAWTLRDLRALGRFATPEMVSYFNEQLSELASRNLYNATSAVRFENGDLSEAWSENNADYATVAMRYSLIDVTTDLTGRVVDGSPTERQVVTELWTFVRARRGGSWLLSAIQQAR
jgi:predicted lipid-binding transport protein (Tim44 family)